MSSANNLAVVDGSKRSVMSFMKTLNRSGPKWHTPLVTWRELERVELILTRWDLFERKAKIQKKRLPLIP